MKISDVKSLHGLLPGFHAAGSTLALLRYEHAKADLYKWRLPLGIRVFSPTQAKPYGSIQLCLVRPSYQTKADDYLPLWTGVDPKYADFLEDAERIIAWVRGFMRQENRRVFKTKRMVRLEDPAFDRLVNHYGDHKGMKTRLYELRCFLAKIH